MGAKLEAIRSSASCGRVFDSTFAFVRGVDAGFGSRAGSSGLDSGTVAGPGGSPSAAGGEVSGILARPGGGSSPSVGLTPAWARWILSSVAR
jgi:hypothetical protein